MFKLQWPISWRKDDHSDQQKATLEGGTMSSRGDGNLNIYGKPEALAVNAVNYSIFQSTPHWQSLSGMHSLFSLYESNPVFYAIVQIKARADSNKIYQVCNRDTDKVEPINTKKHIPAKLYKLLNQPNCLQNRWEFLKQKKIFKEICANTLTYANSSLGFKPSVESINSLWNVWPQYTKFKLTGKYFDAEKKSDIIQGWNFEYGRYKKDFSPEEILHQNMPNTDVKRGLIFGTATAYSLVKPYSNIEEGYSSRNVIIRNRGFRMAFTSDKGDANGRVPLHNQEKEILNKEMEGYGLMEGQSQFFYTSMPMRGIPIDQDVLKLGLFEEIATDAMMCCHGHGVPEILLKLYLSGATFENQKESLKRLYQDTIIPESEDDDIGLNNFFGLDDTDWYIRSSFDHIEYLQKSKKEEASASVTTSSYMERLFLIGGVTLNQWLASVGLPEIPTGNVRLMQMPEEERAFILQVLARVQAPKEEEEQQQNQNGQQQNGQNGQQQNGAKRNGALSHFF